MTKRRRLKTENELRKEDAYLADLHWLLLVFSLPTKRATVRVEVWRKLKRIGALPLGPPGYLLPNSAVNHEHFEWLASTIRSYRGDASVIQVQAIDDLPFEQLVKRFNESRSRDHQELIEDLSRIQKERTINSVQIASLRRRFEDLTAI